MPARWSKAKSIWNAFLKFIWILRKISAKKQDLSISNAEARQLAVMKEVLYDQQQVMGEYEISYKYCLASLYYFKLLCASSWNIYFPKYIQSACSFAAAWCLIQIRQNDGSCKGPFWRWSKGKNKLKLNRILILQNQSYLYFIIL